MFDQMLDFDCHVICNTWVAVVKRACDLDRMLGPIEKIRIAEGNVIRPGRHQLVNIR